MATILYEGSCCVDCLLTIANGKCLDSNGDDITDAISARIARRHPVGHAVAGDETDEFSARPCDACGSHLAGSRHAFAVLSS